MTKRKRRAFTEQFKADAVRLVKASDRGVGQVAKELDRKSSLLPVLTWHVVERISVCAHARGGGR